MPAWNLIRNGLALSLCLLALAPRESGAQSKEYQVKAAFLFNFAQFVQWPDAAFKGTDTPFSIGILGDDPFGTALDETVKGEAVGGHKFTVQRSHRLVDLANCQIIFVSKSEKNHVAQILSALGSRPVLTVGEIEGFARDGGGINFYIDGTKVRFEINPTTAQNGRLKISSQLMSLGKIVSTAKEGK
jgi:hypothetical protein